MTDQAKGQAIVERLEKLTGKARWLLWMLLYLALFWAALFPMWLFCKSFECLALGIEKVCQFIGGPIAIAAEWLERRARRAEANSTGEVELARAALAGGGQATPGSGGTVDGGGCDL